MAALIQSGRFAAAGGAIPVFESAGSGAYIGAADTLNVPYPGTIGPNDILILHAEASENSGSTAIFTPSGWTQIGHAVDIADSRASAIFYRRASGSETGNVTVSATFGGVTQRRVIGRIYRFSGCIASGTPYESFAEGAVTASTTVSQRSVTTTGPNRLCAHFVGIPGTAQAVPDFTGESGGDFAEGAEYLGTAMALQLQIAAKASSGAISGGSCSITSAAHFTHVLALLPT